MKIKTILPGEKIEIQLINRTKKEPIYICNMIDYIDDNTIEITMPIEKSKLIALSLNCEYELFFYTKKGVYHSKGLMINRYKRNNIYAMSLQLLTSLTKVQRREFFRFSCLLELQCRKLTEEEKLKMEVKENFLLPSPCVRGTILDISGGGLRMSISEYYERDELCFCKFPIGIDNEVKEISAIGKIVISKQIENKKDVYEYSIQFEKLSTHNREHLIRYIFEQERRNRKKENGT